jgi:hypothetical protein
VIVAPAGAVWDALWTLRLDDLMLSRTLMRVRAFGRQLAMVTEPFLEHGPVPVLGAEPERAVVAGGALQPWKPGGGRRPPVLDAAGLRELAEPGWVKVGYDFVLDGREGTTRLTTETRVAATDRRTRLLFGVYWTAIRPGSGLIRREMLGAVARAAE